jgi:hypothetical protein
MNWKDGSYKSKFYFSEKEIDFTEDYLDYKQFLLQEFFTADMETKIKLTTCYQNEYGIRSLGYLNRKYSEWANGNYHLTDLMKERILSLMPKFLNDKAKHKLGTHEFIASIKNTVKLFQSSQKKFSGNKINLKRPQDISSIFEKEYDKIQELKIKNFKFNILTESEKEEALKISRYILEIKLRKTFDQVERDLNIFLPFMSKFKRGIYSAIYSIRSSGIKLDITNAKFENLKISKFKVDELEVNNRFKQYSDKYLAYELLSMQKNDTRVVCDSFLNSDDLAIFFEHYAKLSGIGSIVDMNSTFYGEGGTLSISVQIKPLRLLMASIIISLTKLIFYILIIIILVSLAISHQLIFLLVLGGFFLGFVAFFIIAEELNKLKILIKELTTYG